MAEFHFKPFSHQALFLQSQVQIFTAFYKVQRFLSRERLQINSFIYLAQFQSKTLILCRGNSGWPINCLVIEFDLKHNFQGSKDKATLHLGSSCCCPGIRLVLHVGFLQSVLVWKGMSMVTLEYPLGGTWWKQRGRKLIKCKNSKN